ncbi:MAG: hypothetical protein H6713_33460 [Myxococcales bacterium]|nr:hypothetical protein [Myxococcales bacterium]
MSAQDDDLEGDFERDFERDPLLAELGALERALDNPGPRAWEAVIAGERRGADVQAERPDDPEEYAAMFQPLAEGERERLVDALQGALRGDAATEGAAPPISLADRRARGDGEAASRGARGTRRAVWLGGLATLAAAAALLLWIRPLDRGAGDPQALPDYTLVVRNRAVSETRAADDEGPARYRPDTRIDWLLTPETAHEGALSVVVLARAEAGEDRLLEVPGARARAHGRRRPRAARRGAGAAAAARRRLVAQPDRRGEPGCAAARRRGRARARRRRRSQSRCLCGQARLRAGDRGGGRRLRRRARRLVVGASLALGALSGCERGPAGAGAVGDATRPVDARPLDVLLSGCASRTGAVCRYQPGETTLRLWAAAHPDAPLELRLDGERLELTPTPVDHGQRVVVSLARPGLRALELRAPASGERWALALAEDAERRPAEILELDRRAQAGDWEGALRELRARQPELAGAAAAAGLRLEGDILYRLDEHRGALERYAAAMRAAEEQGWLRDAGDIALTATFTCLTLHDFACARTWLEKHEQLIPRDPEARLVHSYYRGLVADRAGDARAALRDYREHATIARRLGRRVDLVAVLSAQAVLLERLGDSEGAEAAHAEAMGLRDALEPSRRGKLLNNVAWSRIEAMSAGRAAPDPIPLLDEALTIFGPGGAVEDPRVVGELRLNRARTWLLRQDAERARRELASLREAPTPSQAMWRDYLEAELAALEARWDDALRGYEALGRAASVQDELGLRWRAAVGQGESLVALRRWAPAEARFREAERLLERVLPRIAIDEGRERFAADRDRGTRGLIALLLARGREDEALCAARLARARTYAALAGPSTPARGARRWRATRRRAPVSRPSVSAAGRSRGARGDRAGARRSASSRPARSSTRRSRSPARAPTRARSCAEPARPRPTSSCWRTTRRSQGPQARRWFGFAADARGVTARRLELPLSEETGGTRELGARARSRRLASRSRAPLGCR